MPVFLISILSQSISNNLFANDTHPITEETFIFQLLKTLQKNDSLKIQELIQQHRYPTLHAANKLLDGSIKDWFEERPDSATIKIEQAEKLAILYHQIYETPILRERVALYKSWSAIEKRAKVRADSLVRVGLENGKAGKLQDAINVWEKTQTTFKELDHDLAVARGSKDIGYAYRQLGQFDPALRYFEETKSIAHAIDEKALEADAIREMGVVSYIRGDASTALKRWQGAIPMFQQAEDRKSEGIATAHIAIYYKNRGEIDKALEYNERALTLAREIGNDSEEANILNNIGNIYMDFLADYDVAISNFERAVKIKKELGELQYVAYINGNIGICNKKKGDYAQAFKYINEALDIAAQLNHKPVRGENLSELATLYTDVGQYGQAAPYYEQALKIHRETQNVGAELETLINYAVNYGRSGDFHKADSLYRVALIKARKAKLISFECSLLANLGSLCFDQGEYGDVKAYWDEALEICAEIHNVRQQSRLFIDYGSLFLQQNDLVQACNRYQEGLNIARKIQAPELIWKAYFGLGQVSEKQNKLNQAVAYYDSSITEIESMRMRIKATSLKESFMEEKYRVYEAIILLLFKLGEEEEAFEYLEKAKAQNLLDILSRDKIKIARGIPPEQLRRKQLLEYKITNIHNAIAEAYSQSGDSTAIEKNAQSLRDSLQAVKNKYEKWLDHMEIENPTLSHLSATSLHLPQVQKALPASTVLIEYFVGEEQTFVWIIRTNEFKTVSMNVKKHGLDSLVTLLLNQLKDARDGNIKNLVDIVYDCQVAHDLYMQIFEPVEIFLRKREHVIIVPDGLLHYLPFEGLVTKVKKRRHSRDDLKVYRQTKYLIHDYNISYTPSATILFLPRQQDEQLEYSGQLLAFGNPDFSGEQKDADVIEAQYSALRLRSALNFAYTPLPKSEQEVKNICNLIKPSVYYLGPEAKEQNFKLYASNYPNIHISTHCVVEESQPLYSKIVFAQKKDSLDDGLLHAFEIFNLQLNADMVTLSACETGLGRFNRGEGLIGLTRAFMCAGTRTLVVSLWSIDEYTGELMISFYENLKKGKRKVEALRDAKLEYISAPKDKTFRAHPFLWAPFILIGTAD
ncbi:CHAT domain-containing protein [candidate division KSB1 bacterium]|nr:CHAT domain-containing protein [candidate division KSB1 bacterium]